MASKNIVLKGATWNGVESVDFPVSGGGTARYIETSDADATASDIANGKKAYVNGSLITGNATAPVLTTKSITQNGTYNASSDSADGYSSVTVNVSGGGGTSIVWGRLRGDATLVKSWSYDGLIVADESVTIPAYSTTDTTLKSGAALTSESLDFSSYSYMLIYRYLAAPVYSNSTISSGRQIYRADSGLYSFIFTPISAFDYGGIEATASGSTQQYSSVGIQVFSRGVYYNSDSSIRVASTNYGAYMSSATYPSITVASSSPYDTATLSITSPDLKIRGNTTQLNSTNWGYITDIRYQYIYELYRVPASDAVHGWELESQFHHILDCVNGNGTLT